MAIAGGPGGMPNSWEPGNSGQGEGSGILICGPGVNISPADCFFWDTTGIWLPRQIKSTDLGTPTDTYTLTADSTLGTGMKWAAAAGGVTFHGCQVYRTRLTTQSVTTTPAAILFANESLDTDSEHDTSSNTGRFTVGTGLAGKHQLEFFIVFDKTTSTMGVSIYKNGSLMSPFDDPSGNGLMFNVDVGASQTVSLSGSWTITGLVATDYLELYAAVRAGSNGSIINGFANFAFAGS